LFAPKDAKGLQLRWSDDGRTFAYAKQGEVFVRSLNGEAKSLTVAMWAFDNGRSRVGVLVGGWAAWLDAGYPVEPKVP
jgi:hypothetical protein